MSHDPTKVRRIVVVDALNPNTGAHTGAAVEFLVPLDATPTWNGQPTAQQVIDFLDAEPEIRAAGKHATIVRRVRAGLNPSQRLIAVVKELKADAALGAWRTKRSVADAQAATDKPAGK